MKENYELIYAEKSRNNWWFAARKELVRSLIRSKIRGRILDIGCGPGTSSPASGSFAIDNSFFMCRHAKKEGMIVCAGDAQKPGFKKNSMDAVLLLDVIEHIDGDKNVIMQAYDILKPGGTAIVTVPAFDFLWGGEDELNEHKRRYSASGLRKLLESNGFEISKISYWNSILFLPTLIYKKMLNRQKSGKESHHLNIIPDFLNGALLKLLRFENSLINHGINLPFGVSIVAVARKP